MARTANLLACVEMCKRYLARKHLCVARSGGKRRGKRQWVWREGERERAHSFEKERDKERAQSCDTTVAGSTEAGKVSGNRTQSGRLHALLPAVQPLWLLC